MYYIDILHHESIIIFAKGYMIHMYSAHLYVAHHMILLLLLTDVQTFHSTLAKHSRDVQAVDVSELCS